ncbi:hypothetical protein ACN47E_010055 [Coniothyrium glycines]
MHFSFSLFKRATFEVTSPRSGDSLVTASRTDQWNIAWTNTTTDPVIISFWEGIGVNLTQKGVVAANAPNNGTYNWRARDDNILYNADSGCAYVLQLTAGGVRIFSDYFSIQNRGDAGIPLDVNCTSGKPPADLDSTQTRGPTSSSASSDASNVSLSTGAIVGIVIGTLAGTLLLCAALLYLAIRRGWLRTRSGDKSVPPEMTTTTASEPVTLPATAETPYYSRRFELPSPAPPN